MSKLYRLGAILLLVGLVGVAWGGANKIPSFVVKATHTDCFGGSDVDITLDDAADGMAILNFVPGTKRTIVQVIVSDFTGGAVDRYIVRLNPDVGDLGTFLVDSQGNGHFHGSIEEDYSSSNVELWQVAQANCGAVLIAYGE